jgi:hypothetical protein
MIEQELKEYLAFIDDGNRIQARAPNITDALEQVKFLVGDRTITGIIDPSMVKVNYV